MHLMLDSWQADRTKAINNQFYEKRNPGGYIIFA
jgi:hypothetical protein